MGQLLHKMTLLFLVSSFLCVKAKVTSNKTQTGLTVKTCGILIQTVNDDKNVHDLSFISALVSEWALICS